VLSRLLAPRGQPPAPAGAIDQADYFGRKLFAFTDNLDSLNRWMSDLIDAERDKRLARIGNWPDDASSVAIVGDAIFAGSMGGAKQLADLAKQKIRDQIFSLPAETLICPGHGPVTTVGEEKANNPFFV